MAIVNAMETVVTQLFEEFRKNYELKCVCLTCQQDILAIALNRLPPRYTSSEKGHLYVKGEFTDRQLQSDVMRELMEASTFVEHHLHHRE
ncbi:late competence development ComFB family protein [Paenibacillus qinlingensis]|uniref:Competence protein ComFB n=1 Tax=Paenibacillus qinlingensis TaxID=1837343 RepID=A0ABU1NUM9_9BACL|nr:late competence development ComFB family protein [Paenibacillus qinlingensis]MDR6551190.1 competence protein ComFB [Paenibacillus qinlingensis]